jgi:Txe/YoeB family toxin of Txe-Axe toxin-antitoxin module
MDQHSPDTLPSVELPSPQPAEVTPETTPKSDTYSEQENAKHLEKVPSDNPAGAQSAAQPAPPTSVPMVTPHDEPAPGSAGLSFTPQIADDTDLIEKEWVERAKRIVEHTKHDPHEQTKEMNSMKADYLKKRYNKDLKLSD